MKFGVCIPNYGESMTVDGFRTVALEAEKLGYDSLWTTDHLLMPVQSGTPYERILDSITSLAYLAPLTSTVKLGVSSLITAMRNPVVVAKQLSTIDNLSGGRVMLATSAGWNAHEFTHLGVNFHDRGRRLDESIKLIRTLWNEPRSTFEGKKIPHKFSEVVFEPRPIQKHLTIWIGGSSKAAMNRAARLGDAWHPNALPLDIFSRMVAEFRALKGGEGKEICVRIGLNTKATQSVYTGPQGERRLLLSGDTAENQRTISELEKLGVTRMIVAPNPDGRVTAANQVESLRMLAEGTIRQAGYIA
jgi:probable F420-dependent oxidoreductase